LTYVWHVRTIWSW